MSVAAAQPSYDRRDEARQRLLETATTVERLHAELEYIEYDLGGCLMPIGIHYLDTHNPTET